MFEVTRLMIRHVGLHVRNLEEEIEFFELLGAEVTSIDRLGNPNGICFEIFASPMHQL